MRISRRTAAMTIGSGMASLSLAPSCGADDDAKAVSDALAGIWSSHYQTTFIYLIIHPHQRVIFALLDQGHSFGEVSWIVAKNGMVVSGFPMLRLWRTARPDRCKVQMQEVPPEMTNDTFVKFPLNFFMTRQNSPLPAAFAEQKIPKDWLDAAPPSDFDDMVGKPRQTNSN